MPALYIPSRHWKYFIRNNRLYLDVYNMISKFCKIALNSSRAEFVREYDELRWKVKTFRSDLSVRPSIRLYLRNFETLLHHQGSFFSINFNIWEFQMKSNCVQYKTLKSMKGMYQSLRRNEMSFRLLTLQNPVGNCFMSSRFKTSLQVRKTKNDEHYS